MPDLLIAIVFGSKSNALFLALSNPALVNVLLVSIMKDSLMSTARSHFTSHQNTLDEFVAD